MASLRADDAQGKPSVHTIKYVKVDGTVGYKRRVQKSFRLLPGASKYRGHMKLNNEFLFQNLEEPDPERQHFRILVDLLVEVDGATIDHTNGEYNGNPNK